MALGISYTPDPELEKLRQAPALEDAEHQFKQRVTQWVEKTSDVRLQDAMATQSCLKICNTISKFINGTSLDAPGNWKDFAAKLNFDRLEIQRMENFTDIQGTATHILSSFAMMKNATVATIIDVLREIQRFDILNEISESIEELLKEKPSAGTRPLENEKLLNRSVSAGQSKKHSRRVLLTFASDGLEKSLKVAKTFKTKEIKVAMLEHNKNQLAEDPWLFIGRCFQIVDFIVPVVTKGYVLQIFGGREDLNGFPFLEQPDACYSRLIFNLMCAEYLQNLCKNYRVRPLVDEDVERESEQKLAVLYPIFFGSHRLGEVEKLADLIRKSKTKRPSLNVC